MKLSRDKTPVLQIRLSYAFEQVMNYSEQKCFENENFLTFLTNTTGHLIVTV